MTPEMAFECLLVSHDPAVCRTIDKSLRNFSIISEFCFSSSKASQRLTKGSHDLIVIDWEGDASSELLHEIWSLDKKGKPTVMAISSTDSSIPGAHVVLRRPVTPQSAAASLKVAYSRMLLDHRQRARYALMTSVIAIDENSRSIPVTVTDIGERGVGLSSKQKLMIGNVLSFSLSLAGTKRPIYIQARVLWTREYATAGCEFLRIPPVDLDILRDWLKRKIRVKKPLISM